MERWMDSGRQKLVAGFKRLHKPYPQLINWLRQIGLHVNPCSIFSIKLTRSVPSTIDRVSPICSGVSLRASLSGAWYRCPARARPRRSRTSWPGISPVSHSRTPSHGRDSFEFSSSISSILFRPAWVESAHWSYSPRPVFVRIIRFFMKWPPRDALAGNPRRKPNGGIKIGHNDKLLDAWAIALRLRLSTSTRRLYGSLAKIRRYK